MTARNCTRCNDAVIAFGSGPLTGLCLHCVENDVIGDRAGLAAANARAEAAEVAWRSLRTELWDGVRAHGLQAPSAGRDGERLIHAYCGGIAKLRIAVEEATARAEAAEADARQVRGWYEEEIRLGRIVADDAAKYARDLRGRAVQLADALGLAAPDAVAAIERALLEAKAEGIAGRVVSVTGRTDGTRVEIHCSNGAPDLKPEQRVTVREKR